MRKLIGISVSISIFLMLLLFASACERKIEVEEEIPEEVEEEPQEPSPPPSTVFDYENIAPHPRLLLGKDEEEAIRNAISSNTELQSIHDHIIENANAMLSEGVVTYEKVGRRMLAVSRRALKRIFYLSYAYRMTGTKSYLDRAEAELRAVCAFPDWNPSHFLDVGEMAMAVAIGYDWLYDDLQGSTKANIRSSILHYAFEASTNRNFRQQTNNWNQVCNAGLLYGALAIFDEHQEEAIKRIEEAVESNRLAMISYAPDGNYPEGAGYWSYGTGFQLMLIAALESALGSDAGLPESPGFLKTAEYKLFVTGPIGKYFNYSDCGEDSKSSMFMFWFANKTNSPGLLFEEKKLLEEGLWFDKLDDSDRLLPAVFSFAKGLNLSQAATPPLTKRVGWPRRNPGRIGSHRLDEYRE